MDQVAIAMVCQALTLPVLVQMVIYVLTPNSSYIDAWKRTGHSLANLFALRTGRDRKVLVAALALTAYVIGLPLALGMWSS